MITTEVAACCSIVAVTVTVTVIVIVIVTVAAVFVVCSSSAGRPSSSPPCPYRPLLPPDQSKLVSYYIELPFPSSTFVVVIRY